MTILQHPATPDLPSPCLAIEFDDFLGFHALVLDDESVIWISDSFSDPDDAERQAHRWWLRNAAELPRKERTA